LSYLNNKLKNKIVKVIKNSKIDGQSLPWAKSIVNDRGKVHQVQCAICLKIEGKERLLVPKFNRLFKHASRLKAKVPNCGVEIGSFYFNLKT
jgi:hypothetical protein